MPDQPAFVIEGVPYPIPTRYRLGDPVLVEEITGLQFNQFAERLATNGWLLGTDPAVLVGLIAVAVWQEKPDWSREKVRRYVQQIGQDGFEWNFPEEPVEEATEQSPPEQEGESPSPSSSDGSTSTAGISATPAPPG